MSYLVLAPVKYRVGAPQSRQVPREERKQSRTDTMVSTGGTVGRIKIYCNFLFDLSSVSALKFLFLTDLDS